MKPRHCHLDVPDSNALDFVNEASDLKSSLVLPFCYKKLGVLVVKFRGKICDFLKHFWQHFLRKLLGQGLT